MVSTSIDIIFESYSALVRFGYPVMSTPPTEEPGDGADILTEEEEMEIVRAKEDHQLESWCRNTSRAVWKLKIGFERSTRGSVSTRVLQTSSNVYFIPHSLFPPLPYLECE